MNAIAEHLAAALITERPHAKHAKALHTYGRFVGHWKLGVTAFGPDGTRHRGSGEVRFGWILEGRAIQDVWSVPPLAERREGMPEFPVTGSFLGTTLRVLDGSGEFWHILWIDPRRGVVLRMEGRVVGNDIVQEGTDEEGCAIRWSFRDIRERSFLWRGERKDPTTQQWTTLVEFAATREDAGAS